MKFQLAPHAICDFCSDPMVVGEFQASDHMVAKEPVKIESVGAWAVCAPCLRLIEGEEWKELERRAYFSFREKYPELPSGHHLRTIQKMQKLFREHMRRSA